MYSGVTKKLYTKNAIESSAAVTEIVFLIREHDILPVFAFPSCTKVLELVYGRDAEEDFPRKNSRDSEGKEGVFPLVPFPGFESSSNGKSVI